MAQFRPSNKVNSIIICSGMHMIGFCPGSYRGKSAVIYVRKELTPAETALDDKYWAKHQSHNVFLAGCMESISQMVYQQNKNSMQEYSIPNWSQKEWVEMKNDDGIEYNFASNVSVTYNGFHKKSQGDKTDINGWRYVIFSYINKKTGEPIQ
ncbi:hypothetical protein VP01_2441g3 [Puccinia sorghi]|uniref:Tet-like 2OG-Fe(II) oxygenase domain-containing protein n=1 Tax=Puccinia sorghi TaxID=27349 RepID=A0A0L6V664_9BASI|nr:hypothetical protein VP01_2441g3 [Puccinia sorghi]